MSSRRNHWLFALMPGAGIAAVLYVLFRRVMYLERVK